MEENKNPNYNQSSYVCCGSILLGLDIIVMCIVYFQIWKYGVLLHQYVTLSKICNDFFVIIFHSNTDKQTQIFF
jgi:hypothetical protein